MLHALSEKGITRLMVEGGARVASSFVAAGLVDEIWLLRGPTPTPVRVRAGVSDGTNTEIETAELHEGDRVVTDAEFPGADSKAAPAGSGAFRRMF